MAARCRLRDGEAARHPDQEAAPDRGEDPVTNLVEKPWIVGAVAVAIVAVAVVNGATALAFKRDVLTEVMPSLLAGLVAIAAITERATAVINDIWFGPSRATAEDAVHQVNRKVNAATANVANVQKVASEAARIGNAEYFTANATVLSQVPVAVFAAEIEDADKALTEVRTSESIARLSLAFLIALVVAAVGVRMLAPMFELGSLSASQGKVFGVVDIVLTAGVLTGGTAGISAISELLGTYVTVSRKRALENK
jgi:hypothetical protein